MPKQSAGLLPFRLRSGQIEVMLVHPGGPIWQGKEDHAWSIPKGQFGPDEGPLEAALREFREETGLEPKGRLIRLEPVRYSGKTVYAWALEADLDIKGFRSSTFTMEWPPGSGRQQQFPEVDRVSWFPLDLARTKILKGQAGLLEQLEMIRHS